MPLDAIDRRILETLQKQGRLSNQDLSERVGLSPSASHRRVQRLEEEGFIAGYVALRDPKVTERLTALGALGLGNSPAEFTEFLAKERAAMARLVREANIRLE